MQSLTLHILTALKALKDQNKAFSIYDITTYIRNNIFIASHDKVKAEFEAILNINIFDLEQSYAKDGYRQFKFNDAVESEDAEDADSCCGGCACGCAVTTDSVNDKLAAFKSAATTPPSKLATLIDSIATKKVDAFAKVQTAAVKADIKASYSKPDARVATAYTAFCSAGNSPVDYAEFSAAFQKYSLLLKNKQYPVSDYKRRIRDRFHNSWNITNDLAEALSKLV